MIYSETTKLNVASMFSDILKMKLIVVVKIISKRKWISEFRIDLKKTWKKELFSHFDSRNKDLIAKIWNKKFYNFVSTVSNLLAVKSTWNNKIICKFPSWKWISLFIFCQKKVFFSLKYPHILSNIKCLFEKREIENLKQI